MKGIFKALFLAFVAFAMAVAVSAQDVNVKYKATMTNVPVEKATDAAWRTSLDDTVTANPNVGSTTTVGVTNS